MTSVNETEVGPNGFDSSLDLKIDVVTLKNSGISEAANSEVKKLYVREKNKDISLDKTKLSLFRNEINRRIRIAPTSSNFVPKLLGCYLANNVFICKCSNDKTYDWLCAEIKKIKNIWVGCQLLVSDTPKSKRLGRSRRLRNKKRDAKLANAKTFYVREKNKDIKLNFKKLHLFRTELNRRIQSAPTSSDFVPKLLGCSLANNVFICKCSNDRTYDWLCAEIQKIKNTWIGCQLLVSDTPKSKRLGKSRRIRNKKRDAKLALDQTFKGHSSSVVHTSKHIQPASGFSETNYSEVKKLCVRENNKDISFNENGQIFRNALNRYVDDMARFGDGPKILSDYLVQYVINGKYYNDETCKWLYDEIKKIEVSCELSVDASKPLLVETWVPGLEDTKTVTTNIELMNPELLTTGWKVVHYNQEANRQLIRFMVDKKSYHFIIRSKLILQYIQEEINFKIILGKYREKSE